MTVDQYIREQRAALSAFYAWWRIQSVTDPVNFPPEMEAGDWDEQFQAFDPEWADAAEDKVQT